MLYWLMTVKPDGNQCMLYIMLTDGLSSISTKFQGNLIHSFLLNDYEPCIWLPYSCRHPLFLHVIDVCSEFTYSMSTIDVVARGKA